MDEFIPKFEENGHQNYTQYDFSGMSNRFIQNLIDNGWELSIDEQFKLQDAYINSMLSEL